MKIKDMKDFELWLIKWVVILLGILALIVLGLAIISGTPAHAAPRQQVLTSLILKMGTREAEFSQSTVDASKIVKVNTKAFKRGITVQDDNGTVLKIRGVATLILDIPSAQVFHLTGVTLGAATGRTVRTSHLSGGVFAGSDWQHWYDDEQVCSFQIGVDQCVAIWSGSLP